MSRRGRSVVTTAVAVAGFAWAAHQARRGEVSAREEQSFRRFNDAPDELQPPVWVVMQAGSLAAVFVAAELVRRRRGRHDAITSLVSGVGVWGGIKLLKPLVGRGRPAHHLDDVQVRGKPQTGLGFPSGHAAVSTTLAIVAASPGLPRVLALLISTVTGGSRMYVGAHLPLDVVGGFAAGVAAAGIVRATVGR